MLEEFLRFMRKHLFIVSGFPAELYSKAIMARIKSFRSINLREFREFLDELSVQNDGASVSRRAIKGHKIE
jgi:hypothetical protein